MYDPNISMQIEPSIRKNLKETVRYIVLEQSELAVSIRRLTRILGEKYGYDFTKIATIIDVLLDDGLARYYVNGIFLIEMYAKDRGYIEIDDTCNMDNEVNR